MLQTKAIYDDSSQSSLGHTRTLIEHPASMTHSVVPPEELEERGIDAGGFVWRLDLKNADDIILIWKKV
jgi:cystathionine beta-lyase/cystathionine gamma-synthase